MATRLIFHIKGQRFAFTRDDLVEVVKATEPERIGKLSVKIEDRMYPVKQPISLVTKLPVAEFTSHQALGILLRFGLPLFKNGDPIGGPPTATGIGASGGEEEDNGNNLAVLSLAVKLHSANGGATGSEVLKTADAFKAWLAA